MIKFKGCPRCVVGDLSLDSDSCGAYFLCLQCGYTRNVDNRAEHQPLFMAALRPRRQPVPVAVAGEDRMVHEKSA